MIGFMDYPMSSNTIGVTNNIYLEDLLAHRINLQASVKPSFTQVVEQAQ